ncbi:helix-turn-helix transcriptional regulator [soil metagenome]
MNGKVQVIARDGKPEYAVLPYKEYKRLATLAEDADDIRAYDEAVASEEELLPAEMVGRLVAGENPLLVWREYRGLTQAQLAEAAGVGQSYIAMIEKGERQGSVTKLRAMARALNVDVDDLIQRA